MYRYTSPAEFPNFTYSKRKHFKLFALDNYDYLLYNKKIDLNTCDLKAYQDLLVFSFLNHNIPEGSKILEVGGADSRILAYFRNKYECWNIDKLEGLGFGLKDVDAQGYTLVKDYMGSFNKELPDNYFDIVFSISALEHVPNDDPKVLKDVADDINRVLKPGGFSLHCFDVIFLYAVVWTNDLLPYMFNNINTINKFIEFEKMKEDEDLFLMSESAFNKTWKKNVKQPYAGFKPLSYNVLWQK